MVEFDDRDERGATPPAFGARYGVWYPLAWRILSAHRFFSPSAWMNPKSAISIDLYLGAWWFLELTIVGLCDGVSGWTGKTAYVAIGIAVIRLLDMAFVDLSLLVKGTYMNRSGFIGGLFLREDGADAPTKQVCPRTA